MMGRSTLVVIALLGMLTFVPVPVPVAGISAAQRPTPTPRPTTLRPRLAARPAATPSSTLTARPTTTLTTTLTTMPTQFATGQVDAERFAAGRQVYLARYCGSCHRLAAAGATGIFGPAHDRIGTVAAQRIASPRYRGSAKTAAEYIRESIVAPAAFLAPTAGFAHQQMPPFTDLTPEELDALVYFLVQQK